MKARLSRWILPLSASIACLGFVSCKSTKKTGYDHVVDYTTPKTGLSESEYPFDEDGNYLADVVSGKKKGKSRKESKVVAKTETYTEKTSTLSSFPPVSPPPSANYELPPEPTSAFASSSSGGGTSYTPYTSYTETETKTVAKSSSSKSRSSASKSKSKPKVAASKPKPKPQPKKPAALTYTIKKGDTLYSLANRYGTSVAAIKASNGMSSNLLRDGKTIRIPKK